MKQFNIRVGLGIIMWGLLSSGLAVTTATAASVTYNFTGDGRQWYRTVLSPPL